MGAPVVGLRYAPRLVGLWVSCVQAQLSFAGTGPRGVRTPITCAPGVSLNSFLPWLDQGRLHLHICDCRGRLSALRVIEAV